VEVVDLTPYIGPILTAIITGGGVYAAITNRLTRLETLISSLTAEVSKHNGVVERTFRLESDRDTIFHQLDEIKTELKELRQ
jgi:hypothetical protein